MISARWKKPCELEICGHARYAEKGKDIVCAGVSTLWGTLQLELDRQERRGRGHTEVERDSIIFHPNSKEDEAEICDIFGMIWGGILLLSTHYRDWIDARREW